MKALTRAGFEFVRQRGSHVTLLHEDGRRVTVPLHREVKRGTLSGILAQAEMSREEFAALLKG
ncbi:MAG: type II toxin-antitoxin system HicA family toxin [Egibacteraceae bacterium]